MSFAEVSIKRLFGRMGTQKEAVMAFSGKRHISPDWPLLLNFNSFA